MRLAKTKSEYGQMLADKTIPVIRNDSSLKAFLQDPNSPLSKCSPETLDDFAKNLKFDPESGFLTSFRYADVAKEISFAQFENLLGKFGISLTLFSEGIDEVCIQGRGCQPAPGYKCFLCPPFALHQAK